jgi:hypothetical protein
MKKVFYPILLLGLVAACNRNQKQQPDYNELAKLLFQQQQAWNCGNLDGFMAYYSRDTGMQFITKKGVRKGWKATLEGYKRTYKGSKDSMGMLDFKIDKMEFLDEGNSVAHINGRWFLYRSSDTPNGHFSLITRREQGFHRIYIDHTW